MDNLLIFAKNPIQGHVKTRLAATVGSKLALDIYTRLLKHTFTVCEPLQVIKTVFFTSSLEGTPGQPPASFYKKLQEGNLLGERMANAFSDAFQGGATRAVVIGTDCPGLSTEILRRAYQALDEVDVVIGPAQDGGYYLLGIKRSIPALFSNIPWSTEHVLQQTLNQCKQLTLTYQLLPLLNDVDEEQDLPYLKLINDD